MQRVAFPFLIALGLSLAASGTAQAKKIKSWKAGPWNGSTHTVKNSDRFSHCVISAKYKSGETLLFAITNKYNLNIALNKATWDLKKGDKYSIGVIVDGQNFGNFRASAATKNTVVVRTGRNTKLFNKLKQGLNLKLRTAQKTFSYKLTKTSYALERTLKCVQSALWDQGESSDPFSGKKEKRDPFSKPGDSGKKDPFSGQRSDNKDGGGNAHAVGQAKTAAFARKVLNSLGDDRIRILDSVPENWRHLKPALIWKGPGVTGIANGGRTPRSTESMEKVLAKADKKHCVGDFASASRERNLGNKGSRIVRVIKTACTEQKNGHPFFVVYSYYPAKGGGFLRIAHVSREAEIANDADRRFFNAVDSALTN